MDKIKNFIISENSIIKEALIKLNESHSQAMTLFIVNGSNQIVGSITDGDIRRGLIKGAHTTDCVSKIMNSDFISLKTVFDVKSIQQHKENGIGLLPIVDTDNRPIDIIDLTKYKSYLPIDAVIMAGGKGERLKPLTNKTPKPLLKVGEKCIIDHNVDRLISYGIKNISVTVNYLKEQIQNHYLTPRNGIKIKTVVEPKYLGTMGSIKYVKRIYSDNVLVMNSDLFTNIDFEDFYLYFKDNEADLAVAAVPYNISIPFGVLNLDGNEIRTLEEKPKFTYYINAGIYLIKKNILTLIPKETPFNATDLIQKVITTGGKVIRYPLNGSWIDIGNMEDYKKAQDLVNHIKFNQ